MFYSESLLSKTGPLARVWLASNLDRKLTKQNVLASNLENNVKDIIGHGQAPMALRLSSQLLLGVVKIYNRKARYLMDDCSDALLKIKMAFRPGNVDLPSDQLHRANPNTLTLPDTITELDLLAPLPDPDELLREPITRMPGHDPTLLDFGASQLLPDTQTPRAQERRLLELDDDDLGLDIGLEPDEQAVRSTPFSEGRSIEAGRRAQTPRIDEPTTLYDDDLGLDTGIGGDTTLRPIDDEDGPLIGDDDVPMGGVDDDNDVGAANAAALARVDAATERRLRSSESPLSSVRSSVERDLEKTFQLDPTAVPEDQSSLIQAPQRAKRRKVLRMDNETEMHNSQIKSLQEDRSAIVKAPSFLPRDPVLLQLMEMQRNGSFVSSLMGDGFMQGWAPELRGIMSLEVVRQAGDKKRKRDSGIADVETDAERLNSPQLEIPPEEEDEGFQIGADQDTTFRSEVPLLALEDQIIQDNDDEIYAASPGGDGGNITFDVTEAPLLHPSQSGPVALGTKKMVHMLREHFAPDHPPSSREPPTPSKRVAASALFTDLCPEARTSRQDATKMFFELLVLGTKDAIKVEQDNSRSLGGPLRVRGKRGLWGDWAEMGTGATQEEEGQGEEGEAVAAAAAVEV